MKKLNTQLITIITISFVVIAILCTFILNPVKTVLIKPKGQYGVGFKDVRLVNGSLINGSYSCPEKTDLWYMKGKNENDFGKDNQKDFCREIMLRIYYPITHITNLPYEAYYSPAMRLTQNKIRLAKVPGIKEKDIIALGKIKTFSIASVNKKFPVILFDPGNGVEVQQYSNIIGNLVSHGYIVLAINNTFIGSAIAFPDGRIVQHFSGKLAKKTIQQYHLHPEILGDILYVRHSLHNGNPLLSTFITQMDLKQIGIFGHSAGAQTGVNLAVRKYPNLFQAGISLDGPPSLMGMKLPKPSQMKAFHIPFLRMLSAGWRCFYYPKRMEYNFKLDNNNYVVLLSHKKISLTKCGVPDALFYTGHLNFTDESSLQYQPAYKAYLKHKKLIGNLWNVGTANGVHISKLINGYMLQFFNQYLKNIPSQAYNHCKSLSKDSIMLCKKK